MDVLTTNIFTRSMSRLRRVTLTADELKDGILTQTIGDFVNPRLQQRYANEIAAIRWLCPTLEEKLKNKVAVTNIKKALPGGVMSAVVENGMRETNVKERNGVVCIDIDAADNPAITDWEAFKCELSKSRFVAYAGLSISGLGVFALIPIADPEKHEQHYNAIEQDFKNATFTFMQQGDSEPTTIDGVNLDPAPRSIASKRYVSYDPQPYINTNAAVYSKTYQLTKPQMTYTRPYTGPSTWSLQGWLDKHGIAYNAREWHGGIQYIVTCPWSHLHTSGKSRTESVLFEDADGKPGYKCQHGHCADKDWHAYREFYDPRVSRTDNISTCRVLSPKQVVEYKEMMQEASRKSKHIQTATIEVAASAQGNIPIMSVDGSICTVGNVLTQANDGRIDPRRVSFTLQDGQLCFELRSQKWLAEQMFLEQYANTIF